MLQRSYAVMTFNRNSLKVYSFFLYWSKYEEDDDFGPWIFNEQSGVTKEDGMGNFHWVFWLLDRLEVQRRFILTKRNHPAPIYALSN